VPVGTLADGSRFGITLYTAVGRDMRLLAVARAVGSVVCAEFMPS
jgi:hypothetical protein